MMISSYEGSGPIHFIKKLDIAFSRFVALVMSATSANNFWKVQTFYFKRQNYPEKVVETSLSSIMQVAGDINHHFSAEPLPLFKLSRRIDIWFSGSSLSRKIRFQRRPEWNSFRNLFIDRQFFPCEKFRWGFFNRIVIRVLGQVCEHLQNPSEGKKDDDQLGLTLSTPWFINVSKD